MTTTISYLKTHWTPEDAHAILSLLDELRDALWAAYGEEIIAYHQRQHDQNSNENAGFDKHQRKPKNCSDEIVDDEKIPF